MRYTNPDLIRYAAEKGYKVHEDGTVIGARGKPIKVGINKGYPCITVLYNTNPRRLDVHRLKAYLLYGEELFKRDIEVRHLNGNKLDYSSKNIVLGTPSENSYDRSEKERVKHSIRAASFVRKFSKEDIIQIKKLNASGVSYSKLTKIYNCSKSTISYIINKKTYKTN